MRNSYLPGAKLFFDPGAKNGAIVRVGVELSTSEVAMLAVVRQRPREA